MESKSAPTPGLSRPERPSSTAMGDFVTRDGEQYFRIASFHRLAPFLMTLASDTDLWMFIASGGGLTAGRVDPDGIAYMLEINPNCGVFYPATDPGSADLCLLQDPEGHEGFARLLVAAALRRYADRQFAGGAVVSTPIPVFPPDFSREA